MARERQILACSGVIYPPADFPPQWVGAQVWQAMQLAGVREPKVCLIATAVGDSGQYTAEWHRHAARHGAVGSTDVKLFPQPNVPDVRAHLMAQDVIFVSGGSVVNLLAVWRAHRLDEILRDCWDAGIVLAGQSAGSLCWHAGGVTDSFGDSLDPISNGLGFLPFSNGSTTTCPISRGAPASASSSRGGPCRPDTRPRTARDCITWGRSCMRSSACCRTAMPGTQRRRANLAMPSARSLPGTGCPGSVSRGRGRRAGGPGRWPRPGDGRSVPSARPPARPGAPPAHCRRPAPG